MSKNMRTHAKNKERKAAYFNEIRDLFSEKISPKIRFPYPFVQIPNQSMDQLSTLLHRHSFNGRVFFNGEFCGANSIEEEGRFGHLHIVRKGRVLMNHEDGTTVHLNEPGIVFYIRGLNHRLCVPAGTSAKLLCARIQFDGGRQNPLAKALPDILHIPLAAVPRLAVLLDMLFSEADEYYPGQQLTLDRLCDVVVVHVMRHAYETGQLKQSILSGLADRGLSRALVLMHDDPAHPWDLHSLAKECGMSRSKFAKHFHDVLAETPADYLAGRRMLLAQHLLKKNKPVKAIASEVGYASQPAFTKAFTAKIGMSPREWLKMSRQAAL